jgi:hypothetical protein
LKRAAFALFSVVAALLLSRAARAENGDVPEIAVVDARGVDVPAVSVTAVTRQLYATVARLGYRATPESATATLASRVGPAGAAPVELLGVAVGAHARSALSATLGARDGRYVVTLTLANADRTGPFYATDTADAASLEGAVDQLTRSLLGPAVVTEASSVDPHQPTRTKAPDDERYRFAVQTEGALGVANHFFYNQLAGVRLDREFSSAFALGGYLGYANLKGKDGRVSNLLPYVQLEYALHFTGTGFAVPLRFGTGYLPKNGPFIRFAAGARFPVGDSVYLGFDLLAPTVWVVKNSTVVSMDLAAELEFAW